MNHSRLQFMRGHCSKGSKGGARRGHARNSVDPRWHTDVGALIDFGCRFCKEHSDENGAKVGEYWQLKKERGDSEAMSDYQKAMDVFSSAMADVERSFANDFGVCNKGPGSPLADFEPGMRQLLAFSSDVSCTRGTMGVDVYLRHHVDSKDLGERAQQLLRTLTPTLTPPSRSLSLR